MKKKTCSIARLLGRMHAPDAADWAFGRTVVSARKPRLRPPALAPLLRRRREPQPAAAPATDHHAVFLPSRTPAPCDPRYQGINPIAPPCAPTISVRQCRSHLVRARSRLRWDCFRDVQNRLEFDVEVVHLLSAGLNL